eukprot:9722833-Prorocentrum_lima.AAC.1
MRKKGIMPLQYIQDHMEEVVLALWTLHRALHVLPSLKPQSAQLQASSLFPQGVTHHPSLPLLPH